MGHEYEWKKDSITTGRITARALFKKRGNHSEMHVSESELATIVTASINLHLSQNVPLAEMLAALKAADDMNREALPKFNWGASALDSRAITLLNETPGKVRAAIAKAEGK